MRAARVCVPRVIMVWFYGFLLLDLVGFLCFGYLKEYFQLLVRIWVDLGNKTTWLDLGHKTTRSDFGIDKTWLGFGKDTTLIRLITQGSLSVGVQKQQ